MELTADILHNVRYETEYHPNILRHKCCTSGNSLKLISVMNINVLLAPKMCWISYDHSVYTYIYIYLISSDSAIKKFKW